MNVDIPNLIKAAVPESEGRNARIMSSNGPNHRDPGFLSKDFPRSPPKLYLTAESDEFDELTLAEWRDEGFDVQYISIGSGGDGYQEKLRALSRKKLGPCEAFGIIGRRRRKPNPQALKRSLLTPNSIWRRSSPLPRALPRHG